MSTSGAGRGGLGAGLQQAFHQVITRRATDVFVGGDGAHDLVDLVPVHVHLLGKRLVHRHERGGDSGARGGVLAQQAELADCFLALDVAGKRLRVSLKQAGGGLSGLELVLEWVTGFAPARTRLPPRLVPSLATDFRLLSGALGSIGGLIRIFSTRHPRLAEAPRVRRDPDRPSRRGQ